MDTAEGLDPGKGLVRVGEQTDEVPGARRFDVSYPTTKGLAQLEVGAQRGEATGGTRTVLRYALGPAGFVRVEAAATAPRGSPAR